MDACSNGKKEYTAQGEERTLWDGSKCVVLDNLTAVERAGYPFAFPRNRRHGGPVTQLAKMREELEEVAVEVDGGTCVDMLVETMDLIEAAEGLLRGYEGTRMLDMAWHDHYQKNLARGDYEARSWYDEQPPCDGECEECGYWNGATCTRPEPEED